MSKFHSPTLNLRQFRNHLYDPPTAAFGDYVSNSDQWMYKKISMKHLIGTNATDFFDSLKSSECWVWDAKESTFKRNCRFFLVLAPISRYPKISNQVKNFFLDALPDNERATIVKFFQTQLSRTNWSTKFLCIMGYGNEPDTVLGAPPAVASAHDDSSSSSRATPSKEIISAVVFSQHPRDGCFIHMVATKMMSPEKASQLFSSDQSPNAPWMSNCSPENGVFRRVGLARYLLSLTQACTAFDPRNENIKLWLDASSLANPNFYRRIGFGAVDTISFLPDSFMVYHKDGQPTMFCGTVIAPFHHVLQRPRPFDPFGTRDRLAIESDFWGVQRSAGENHCYIASFLLALCHCWHGFGGSWSFKETSEAHPARELSVVYHQTSLRTGFVDVMKFFREIHGVKATTPVEVKEKFDQFLAVLETIPQNIVLDHHFKDPPKEAEPFSTTKQDDVCYLMHFLLNTMELSSVMFGTHTRKRFVEPEWEDSWGNEKGVTWCNNEKEEALECYSLGVFPKPSGTMSECIAQEIGIFLPDEDHVRGVRKDFPEIPAEQKLQRLTVLRSSVDNRDEKNGLPRRLIVHTSQGCYVERGRSRQKRSEIAKTPVAGYVSTISLDVYQYQPNTPLERSEAGLCNTIVQVKMSMVLKGFVHYKPVGRGDSGHYICFVYHSYDSWLVYDDDEVFLVSATFALYFAPYARVWMYEQPPHEEWDPPIPKFNDVDPPVPVPRDEMFKRWEEIHQFTDDAYVLQLEYLAMVFHIVYSKRQHQIPAKTHLLKFLSGYILGPSAYVADFANNFYDCRIKTKDADGKDFLQRMNGVRHGSAEDVLMSFARARVGYCKAQVEKMCTDPGNSAVWMHTVDGEPRDKSRRNQQIVPIHVRVRDMILKDIKESLFFPDYYAPFSDVVIQIVDEVVKTHSESERNKTPTTIVISSPRRNAGGAQGTGTMTPDIISLASSDDEGHDMEGDKFAARFQSDFQWKTRFEVVGPSSPKCSTLHRRLSETEQLWLVMLRFISDGALCEQRKDRPLWFLSYTWSDKCYRDKEQFMGAVDYTAFDRIFKDEFLSGDQGSHYISLLQQRQFKLERDPGGGHQKILFLDSRIMEFLENNPGPVRFQQ